MNSYEVRAQKFLLSLFPYIERACASYGARSKKNILAIAVDMYCADHPTRKIRSTCGYTRMAIITSDYVIKFDFNMNTQFGTCEDEISAYELAEQDGYEDYFAKPTRYTRQGWKFYIMPKVTGIGRLRVDADDACNDKTFCRWLYKNKFFDLHCHNYGWKDGHIVIFDYAARGY